MISRRGERGSALLLCVIIALVVIGISGAYVTISIYSARQTHNTSFGLQALYLAEAGAARYIAQLNFPAIAATEVGPRDYLSGQYRILRPDDHLDGIIGDDTGALNYGQDNADNDGDGQINNAFESSFQEFIAVGTVAGITRRISVVITGNPPRVFDNAMYAGNSSRDGAYQLYFGGPASGDRDLIKGNIYSGGGLRHEGYGLLQNAQGTGPSSQVMYDRAGGLDTSGARQSPPPTYVNGNQPGLDIASMNYDARASTDPQFVNVNQELLAKGSQGFINGQSSYNQGNGKALQIRDVNEPAHMFRMNPSDNGISDRNTSTAGMNTAKNDFYLEDPTKPKASGSAQGNWLGSDGGMRVEMSPTGNNKVYYIDGNLWIHSSPTYTYQLMNNTGQNMNITFVVKGNIYLSDNLLYHNGRSQLDALAMIAIKDPTFQNKTAADFPRDPNPAEAARRYNALNGSGNIFYGDPAYGTTERFEAFMYAENNFYDQNLTAGGTNETNIYGTMSAGNQVLINRGSTTADYKPLKVTLDPGVTAGYKAPPGIPPTPAVAGQQWTPVSWRPVP